MSAAASDRFCNEIPHGLDFEDWQGRVDSEYGLATSFFSMYHARGEADRAFSWFERALEERDFMVPFCMNWPDYDMCFPDEKRYKAKLREVGVQP